MEGSGYSMLVGGYKQSGEGGGKKPMGAVFEMGVWDRRIKVQMLATVLARGKNGLQPKL